MISKFSKFNAQNLTAIISIIAVGAVIRFLPHPPNFTPIAATALFGGAYLNKKYAFIVPLAAMFISDIFLGFHATMPYVYGSFLLTGAIGLWLKKHKNAKNIIGATLLSSILFFLITNFGVWAQGAYARDFSGLLQSYVLGIPFFRNTLLGDFCYVGIFFGCYELIQLLITRYSINKARS